MIRKLFGNDIKIVMPTVQKQVGSKDCGLFAIAISMALMLNVPPSTKEFNQSFMRSHLVSCLENGTFTMFL